jgi:hypothetical protein
MAAAAGLDVGSFFLPQPTNPPSYPPTHAPLKLLLYDDENYLDIVMIITRSSKLRQVSMGWDSRIDESWFILV